MVLRLGGVREPESAGRTSIADVDLDRARQSLELQDHVAAVRTVCRRFGIAGVDLEIRRPTGSPAKPTWRRDRYAAAHELGDVTRHPAPRRRSGRRALAAWAIWLVTAAVVACGGPSGASPSGAASASPAPPSPAPTPSSSRQAPSPAAGTSAGPTTAVASTPLPGSPSAATTDGLAAELIAPGRLVACSSFPRQRFAERDAAGEPFGIDIEIGQEIARRLGLEPEVRDVVFDSLLAEVERRQCDVSIAGQFITGARLARIAMIPYRQGAPQIVVPAGNPGAILELLDLCGRRLAVVTGSVYVEIVRGLGDYVGNGLDDRCRTAGAEPVDLREYANQGEAEDALARGLVHAYVGNDAIAVERPSEFELSAAFPPLRNGIGHARRAALLGDRIRTSLRAMIDDGSYLAILARYGAQGAALTDRP